MERRTIASKTCRAWDNRNPELGEVIKYMILENQGDLKEFATEKRAGQAGQRARGSEIR